MLNIFILQKKKLRTGTNTRKKESCNLKILTLQSQYIFLLLCFVCNNNDWYIRNLDIHGINTRCGSDIHYPTSTSAIYH